MALCGAPHNAIEPTVARKNEWPLLKAQRPKRIKRLNRKPAAACQNTEFTLPTRSNHWIISKATIRSESLHRRSGDREPAFALTSPDPSDC